MNKYGFLLLLLLLTQIAFAQKTHQVKVSIGLSDCQVLSVERSSSQDIEVYPNPTRQYLTIKHQYHHAEAVILDTSGRIIYRTPIDQTASRINIEQLADGLYLLQVRHQDGVEKLKILLKR